MPKPKTISQQGPMPRPSIPDEARQALKQEAFPSPNVQSVRLFSMEFTSLCPRTGQPDYGSVSIEYAPNDLCLESKSLKYYLWSYRDEGEFCEGLAGRIADDIVFAIDPKNVQVEVTQNTRGGIAILARALRGSPES